LGRGLVRWSRHRFGELDVRADDLRRLIKELVLAQQGDARGLPARGSKDVADGDPGRAPSGVAEQVTLGRSARSGRAQHAVSGGAKVCAAVDDREGLVVALRRPSIALPRSAWGADPIRRPAPGRARALIECRWELAAAERDGRT
jgi:hypothetical protein